MKNCYKLDYEILGTRIKKARKMAGLTQNALAEQIYLTTNQIAKLETNKTTASLETIVNIANALDLDINYLLRFEEEPNAPDYMDLLIINQLKDFTTKEKEALLLVINAMKNCKTQ